ncbi:MAG TPA: hypothetical protein VL997_04130 [Dyella sp.]|nr:hypothetical protein [Dyella sp.]
MAISDKIISGALLTHGLYGCVWTIQLASSHGYPGLFLLPNTMLALAGVVAGIGCFRGKRWAAYTGLVFWGIQIIDILTPTFQFSFTLGLNAVLAAGWYGVGQFGVNIFALILLLWLLARTRAPGSPFHRVSEMAAT